MNTIDMSFRPETYWPESLTPEQLLSKIRGKKRQDIARRLFEEHGFGALNEFLVKEKLTKDERSEWGAVHPICLGGEFLPDLQEDEVEIARISLASTTYDQISVRARRDGNHIRYRIVGEYEEDEDMRYVLPFDTTDEPLSLAELMILINTAHIQSDIYPGGILGSNWLMMKDFDYEPEEIIGFLSLNSAFYPEIDRCYREMAHDWVESNVEATHG